MYTTCQRLLAAIEIASASLNTYKICSRAFDTKQNITTTNILQLLMRDLSLCTSVFFLRTIFFFTIECFSEIYRRNFTVSGVFVNAIRIVLREHNGTTAWQRAATKTSRLSSLLLFSLIKNIHDKICDQNNGQFSFSINSSSQIILLKSKIFSFL